VFSAAKPHLRCCRWQEGGGPRAWLAALGDQLMFHRELSGRFGHPKQRHLPLHLEFLIEIGRLPLHPPSTLRQPLACSRAHFPPRLQKQAVIGGDCPRAGAGQPMASAVWLGRHIRWQNAFGRRGRPLALDGSVTCIMHTNLLLAPVAV